MSEESVSIPSSADSANQQNKLEVLVFQIGSRNFCIEIRDVAEIIRYREPTSVPNTIHYLDGIISYRGKMVPVLNGRKRLGYLAAVPDLRTSIIIVREGAEVYGIVVDFASLVIEVPENEIQPASLPEAAPGMIRGMFIHKNQEMYLLSLPLVLEF
jgi:purine-binding chemotaxis protein CheW